MTRWTAIGPALDGCHEIPAEVAAEFLDQGGEDIQVWDGTNYIIEGAPAAMEYAATALSLSFIEEAS